MTGASRSRTLLRQVSHVAYSEDIQGWRQLWQTELLRKGVGVEQGYYVK